MFFAPHGSSLLPCNQEPALPGGFLALMRVLPLIVMGWIAALAIGLRLYNLGEHGFWYDEVVTAHVTRLPTLGDTVAFVQSWGDHAPLTYMVTWLLRGLGGGEWAVRLPFAIAGALSVGALFLLGRTILPLRAALIATFLMAVAPFAVYYSQEARLYSYLMLLTSLQMLTAFRAVTRSSRWDWLALTLLSIAILYTGYLGIFTTGVAFAFVGIALFAQVVRNWRGVGKQPLTSQQLITQCVLAATSAILTLLAYLPWLPQLEVFLSRRDLGFGRLRGNEVTLGDVYALFVSLNLDGLMLVLMLVGLCVVVAWAVRGKLEGWLMLTWLGLPLMIFLVQGGSAIVTLPGRYFSFLFPLAMLLVGLGAHTLAEGGAKLWVMRWQGAHQVRLAIIILLTALALVQTIPHLFTQYATPKSEFREAARAVTEGSPPGSVVLAIGPFNTSLLPPFVRETIEYYYRLWNAPIAVIEGTRLDDATLRKVESAQADLWMALFTEPRLSDFESATAAGLEVRQFNSLTMVRAEQPRKAAEAQARLLLHWGASVYPALASTRMLFDSEFKRSALGDNMLPSSANNFRLTPEKGATIATLETSRLEARQVYVLSFMCDTISLDGEARVYVDTFDVSGAYLETLPENYGYLCAQAETPTRQATTFRATNNIATLRIRLTASGKGVAGFSKIELRPLHRNP